MESIVTKGGYFTWIAFLLDMPPVRLEERLGYKRGALSAGWQLLTPFAPIPANLIDLRGSTRWEDGALKDKQPFASGDPNINRVIARRGGYVEGREKVAAFFDKKWENTPAKVLPLTHSHPGYEAAGEGIPQFRLWAHIDWVVHVTVMPGMALDREKARSLLA
jgi:hypothetical protein